MPEFDGQLQRSASNATLVSLDFSDGSQIKGIGIFESISGSTPPTRNGLPTANRSDGYIAIVKDVDKVYVFHGDPSTSWTNTNNWTEVGAGSGTEVNDLTSSVTWANVPDANITQSSVTQHQAALTIAQSQVTGLTGAQGTLTSLQNQITLNDSDIATNASGISTNAQNIITLQNDVSSNDTDIQQLQTDLAAEISATNSDVSNLQSQITSNDGDITSLQSDVSGIQTELNTTQASAGLNANGAYSQNTSANYIAAVASLNAADVALDTQIKTNETNISSINTTINGLNTDDIPEAVTNPTNLYYTEARFNTSFGNKDTSDLSEGSNLYYTDARFDTRFSAKSTDDLSQGTSNLYFPGFGTTAGKALEGNTALFDGDYNNLSNIPSTFTPSAHNQAWSTITGTPTTIAGYGITDAFDGDYNNLINLPSLATVATSGSYTDLTNTPNLAAVATSGSYTDLTNTPTTITSQQSTEISNNTTHSGIISGNPHGTSITNLVGVPSTLGSYKNVLTVHQNGTELEYSDLIEEITNEVLDLVNTSSSYTLNSADLDGDGLVGINDLLELLAEFGQQGVDSPFLAAWDLNDSNSSLSYAGSSNESDQFGNPSDSTTNLLILEAPAQVSAYSPWSITTNTNNETLTIAQTSGNSAGSVEYNKDLDFQDPLTLEVQQTESTSTAYHVFLKAVYSYPTASDLTIWHPLGSFSHDLANYDPASTAGTEKVLPVMSIEDILSHTSAGTSGDEYPSSVTMSFRYMKPAEGGNGYVRLKRAHFQWKS